MAIKDVFTLVDVADETLPGPRAAFGLAQRTGAHVTGLALAMEPYSPGFLASPLPADFLVGALEEAERNARTACERFRALAETFGVSAEARTETILAGASQPIVARAYLSDLVVVGQEHADILEPMRGALIEALLFDAGVPVLVIPHGWSTPPSCERAVVAWDGSATAARAVHAALPVLCLARSVEVLIVASDKVWRGEPGVDVATHLARHGLPVSITTVNRRDGEPISHTLIHYLREAAADLCVMGAYGHSRVREFIIGGPTADMLERTPVPTLMMH